jgi:hypothetical protein
MTRGRFETELEMNLSSNSERTKMERLSSMQSTARRT